MNCGACDIHIDCMSASYLLLSPPLPVPQSQSAWPRTLSVGLECFLHICCILGVRRTFFSSCVSLYLPCIVRMCSYLVCPVFFFSIRVHTLRYPSDGKSSEHGSLGRPIGACVRLPQRRLSCNSHESALGQARALLVGDTPDRPLSFHTETALRMPW